MTLCRNRFNTYFLCVLALALVCGCQTEARKKKHAVSTLRLHLECSPYDTDRNQAVEIPREHPSKIYVEKQCFLTEANVAEAKVMSNLDGFVMTIQMDNRGKLWLEQYSAANRGHRFAIYSQFGEKLATNRWLAAPVISRVIKDGTLMFTPDASRAEAEQIVLGLNNVAKKVQEKSDW